MHCKKFFLCRNISPFSGVISTGQIPTQSKLPVKEISPLRLLRRSLPLFCALILSLSLAACGERSKARPSSGTPETSSLPIQPPAEPAPPSESPAIPQADEALVKEIVLTYGAAEDTRNTPGRIYPRKRSLYTGGEGWSSPEALSVGQYVTYAYIAIPYDDLAPFQQDNPPGVLQFFPQELLEEAVQQHFDVTTRHLRSDPAYYDEARGGYVMPAGSGVGVLPGLTYQYSQEGELLTIIVTLDFPDTPNQQHTLTVRLEPDGGWRYLSDEVKEAAG